MSAITAIFEDGVFRPTEPVALPDRCEVDLEFHVRRQPDLHQGNGKTGAAADWEAAARAAEELQQTGYDFDAWQRQREFDVDHARSQP